MFDDHFEAACDEVLDDYENEARESEICFACRGSGEGVADGTQCAVCGGKGEI